MTNYLDTITSQILKDAKSHRSNILPSEWYEENMVMPKGSALAGKFSYDHTPFMKEIVDCASPYHPAREISIMKGAQVGGTATVLNPLVGYTIAVNPGNTMFLTGHTDLSKDAMEKIDQMIDCVGIRGLIGGKDLRARNTRSGDTLTEKKFKGGYLKMGSVTNHNLLRQHDIMIMIVDDYDAAAMSSKFAGATRELVQKRTAAYKHKKKIFWVSSPQVEGRSNIEEVFLLGDQRYYNVPCPCCGEFITLEWTVDMEGSKEKGGIYYEVMSNGRVDEKSVGYICQKCAGFFDDTKKYEMNLSGFWQPTAEPKEKDHYSYHISSLYAPPFMDDWAWFAQQFVNANPKEGKRNEKKMQTFMNVVLGKTYKQKGKEIKANALQKNTRNYDVGDIPDQMSLNDGNGHIILLTCSCDLNGYVEDARLDYEIVGWSENETRYSITHGSIGTFVNKRFEGEKGRQSREKWTYEFGKQKNVWKEFDKILDTRFMTDNGRAMKIFMTGVDTSYFTDYAYKYIDSSNFPIIGLKGDPEELDKATKYGVDAPIFKQGKSRSNLYIVESNLTKDILARDIDKKWDKENDEKQPNGYMNFPTPSGGKYLYNNYFSHFEAEHRVLEEKDGKPSQWVWAKKSSYVQNHLFDCHLYNIVVKNIVTYLACKEMNIKDYNWEDFVKIVLNKQ